MKPKVYKQNKIVDFYHANKSIANKVLFIAFVGACFIIDFNTSLSLTILSIGALGLFLKK